MTATLYPRVTLASIKAPGRYSLVGGPFGSKLVSADYVGDGVPSFGEPICQARHVSPLTISYTSQARRWNGTWWATLHFQAISW